MELKGYLSIIRRDTVLFVVIILIIVGGAALWQKSQAPSYGASLLLNVGRSGIQETTEYSYDSFYRLQADERFGDTVVRWLGSPRVVEDIYTQAEISSEALGARDFKKAFTGKRLSSQVIEVTYGSRNEKILSDLSGSIVTVLNRYTESLNKEKNDTSGWFVIIGSEPVIRDTRIAMGPVAGVSLLVGIFVSFWVVLLKYYFTKT